ncbi:hypothetical protein OROHE_021688 [Orobanche hederae]
MKSHLEKLRNIGLHKSGPKGKWDQKFSVHTDGLNQAAKDMKDMRACYDSLLSAAAATANSAYEFSESLLEMGSCLLEKTVMHDNGESIWSTLIVPSYFSDSLIEEGALSILGKLQLELQKLVDTYRSHIIMTITNPSESLLSEIRKVEEMKLQCDEKREMFKYMTGHIREKEMSRHGKGETFTSQQLQVVCEEYDDVARLCIFRVESLKQGQSRSLLTQAARHHAAQINFFRRGLQSLEAVEPLVKNVAEKQHIDYELLDLNDEEGSGVRNSSEINDYGELSFDYRQHEQELDNTCTSTNPMELDQLGAPGAQTPKKKDAEAQINSSKYQGDHMLSQQRQAGSYYSAPIYEEKFDFSERIREMRTAVPKHCTHVLPTPADAKATALSDARGFSNPQLGLQDNNYNKHFIPLPRPRIDGAVIDNYSGFDTQKNKRQAFSDSLASKPSSSSNKPMLYTSCPQSPSLVTVSRNASPPLSSSPKISELHELPRPPDAFRSKPKPYMVSLGHSAPLVNRNRELSPTNRNHLRQSKEGSPLPLPQLTVSRSFSIVSVSQMPTALHSGKLLGSSQILQSAEQVDSPPLTPLSLSNLKSPNYGAIRGKSN